MLSAEFYTITILYLSLRQCKKMGKMRVSKHASGRRVLGLKHVCSIAGNRIQNQISTSRRRSDRCPEPPVRERRFRESDRGRNEEEIPQFKTRDELRNETVLIGNDDNDHLLVTLNTFLTAMSPLSRRLVSLHRSPHHHRRRK